MKDDKKNNNFTLNGGENESHYKAQKWKAKN